MPKKSNSVSKPLRIDQLRKVLSRWGRLNKQQIDQYLSAHLNVDKESVSRTLARDLEELEKNHEVQKYYFTRDGYPIEEFDPDVHKNTYCEWTIVGDKSEIKGENILNLNSGAVLGSKSIKSSVELQSGFLGADNKKVSIFFNIGSDYVCLRVEKDVIPFTLIVSRMNPKNSIDRNTLAKFEEEFGSRILVLSIPHASISSFKSDFSHYGHAAIDFNEGDVKVRDLESKNSTFVCQLKEGEAKKIWERAIMNSNITQTVPFDHLINAGDFQRVKINQHEKIELPCVIYASEHFPFLLI